MGHAHAAAAAAASLGCCSRGWRAVRPSSAPWRAPFFLRSEDPCVRINHLYRGIQRAHKHARSKKSRSRGGGGDDCLGGNTHGGRSVGPSRALAKIRAAALGVLSGAASHMAPGGSGGQKNVVAQIKIGGLMPTQQDHISIEEGMVETNGRQTEWREAVCVPSGSGDCMAKTTAGQRDPRHRPLCCCSYKKKRGQENRKQERQTTTTMTMDLKSKHCQRGGPKTSHPVAPSLKARPTLTRPRRPAAA